MRKKKFKRKNKNDAMYAKYGEHSPGIYCGGCINCQKREREGRKWTYKCLVYGVTKTYETDWNPMFTACGYFNMPFNSRRDTPLIKTESYKRIMKSRGRKGDKNQS